MQYRIGRFTLDSDLFQLREGARVVSVSPQSLDLLLFLVENRERVVSKREIMDRIWPDRIVTENSLSQCISAARRSLGDDGRARSVIETVYGRGFRFAAECDPCIDARSIAGAEERQRSVPSIAVLPFEPLGGDAGQDYFADGLSEDLATRLAAWRVIPMIARASSFRYRGRTLDLRGVGLEMGADYLVHGSVRRSGATVRVSAQLTESAGSREVWADSQDMQLGDIFACQNELARRVAAAVYPEVLRDQRERVVRRDPEDLTAWEWALRADWHLRRSSEKDNREARDCLERALALDPRLVFGLGLLAETHYVDVQNHWSSDPLRSLAQLKDATGRCLDADPEYARGHMLAGLSWMIEGERSMAMSSMRTAIRSDPSLAQAHSLLGQLLAMNEQPDEGVPHVESAIRLSPKDPDLFRYYASLARVHFAAERFDDAIVWSERSLRMEPSFGLSHACLASSLGLLGRIAEGRKVMARLMEVWPRFQTRGLPPVFASHNERNLKLFLDGLEKVGFRDLVR